MYANKLMLQMGSALRGSDLTVKQWVHYSALYPLAEDGYIYCHCHYMCHCHYVCHCYF